MKSYVFKQVGYKKKYTQDGEFVDIDDSCANVLFIGGIHGNELGTIRLAYDLIREFESYEHYEKDRYKDIGIIAVIPCVNESGMRNNTREVSENYADLNRGWCDNPRNDLLMEIDGLEKEYGIKFHIVVDMHCSPNVAPMFLLNRNQTYVNDIVDAISHTLDENVSSLNDVYYCVRDTRINTLKRQMSNNTRIILTYEQSGYEVSIPKQNSRSMSYFTDTFIPYLVPRLRSIINNGSKYPTNTFDKDYLCRHIICNTEGILRIPTTYECDNDYGYHDIRNIISNGDTIAEVLDVETNEVIEEIKWYHKPFELFPHVRNARIIELETSYPYEKYVTPGTIIAMVQPLISVKR